MCLCVCVCVRACVCACMRVCSLQGWGWISAFSKCCQTRVETENTMIRDGPSALNHFLLCIVFRKSNSRNTSYANKAILFINSISVFFYIITVYIQNVK